MKIAKIRFDYVFLIYVPFALIGICLIAFALNITLAGIQWLMLSYLPISLLVAFSPIGSKNLLKNESAKTHSIWQWLGKILLLQLSVLLIFTALTQANIHLLNSTDPTTNTIIAQLTQYYWQTCLLPWPWTILVSLALIYFGKKQNQPALLLTTVKPIIRFFADNIIGVGIEIFIRQALSLSSLLVFAIITFFLADLISQLLHLPGLLLSTNHAFILSMFIFILISIKPFLRFTRWLWQKHWQESRYMLLFCGLLFTLIFVTNVILSSVDPFVSTIQLPPLRFKIFSEHDWMSQWKLVSYCWWIGIMPLLAKHLANISRGRTVRTFILGNLLLPFLLAGLSFLISPSLLIQWLTAWPITLVIGVASLLLAAHLYQNPETCGITTLFKTHTQLTLTYFRNNWHLGAALIIVYLVSQLSFIYIFSIAITLPVLATIFVAAIGAAFVAIQKR